MTRVAFAGLGAAVHTLHLPALERLPEAHVVGGCDPSPAARAEFSQRTNASCFDSQEEMLGATAPELVVVATPPETHEELCAGALAAGAHVLCEKPLAPTLDAADRLLAAAQNAGRVLSVHHGFREQAVFRALREHIESGAAGALLFCQLWQLVGQAPWEESARWRAERPDRSLLEGGIHVVDLLLSLYADRPLSVTAERSAGGYADATADAVQLVSVEFPGDRLGHVVIDRLCRGGDRYLEVRADCEQASLRASWGGRALLSVGKKRARRAGIAFERAAGGVAWEERGLRRRTLARDPRRPAVGGTIEFWRRLLDSLGGEIEPPSPGSQARTALEVVTAAYRSADEGRRVALASTSSS